MAIHQKNWHVIHQTYRISNNTTKFNFYHGTPWVKYWYEINKILNEIADSFLKEIDQAWLQPILFRI